MVTSQEQGSDTSNGVIASLVGERAARQATPTDAQTLAAIYNRLDAASKAHTKAIGDFRKALATWNPEDGVIDMPDDTEVQTTSDELTHTLIKCRREINALPAGTTAKGGANRQSVVMQFYGPVNRELGKRLTAADARKVNAASFG